MGEPVIGLLATPPIQYGVPLEYGTKPHGVSIEGQKNLLLWVEKKMGCSGKEAVKIMKAITWKIYHHGTKGAHMFEEGFTENETKIIRILEKIGLNEKLKAYPSEISGGQQQRVGIARALALNPKVILFDEPTSALDPELVGEVLQAIKIVAREGITMIVVTHEIDFALDIATKVVFMDGGLIVEQGMPDEVISHPKEERTRQFLRRLLPETSFSI